MVSRIRPWGSFLWVSIEAVLRSNPSWIWMHVILFFIPNWLWLWIEEVCGPNPLCMWTEGDLASNPGPSAVVTSRESQNFVEDPTLNCTGDAEAPHGMALTDLPDELVEAILLNFSLHELARVSSTCRAFHIFCRSQLAREHNARCDIAARCVGEERLMYIALIFNRFLRGEPLDPEGAEGKGGKWSKWIPVSEETEGEAPYGYSSVTYKAGDMEVTLEVLGRAKDLLFQLPVLEASLVEPLISISTFNDQLSIRMINMGNGATDVMEWMAVLQALLSGPAAPLFPDAGCLQDVTIRTCGAGESWKPKGVTLLVPSPFHRTFSVVGIGGTRFMKEDVRVTQKGWWMGVGPSRTGEKLSLKLNVQLYPKPCRGLLYDFLHYLSRFSPL